MLSLLASRATHDSRTVLNHLWHGTHREMGREVPRTPVSPHATANTFSRGLIGWVKGMQELAFTSWPHGRRASFPTHRNSKMAPVDEAWGARGRPNPGFGGVERLRWVPRLTLVEYTTLPLRLRPRRIIFCVCTSPAHNLASGKCPTRVSLHASKLVGAIRPAPAPSTSKTISHTPQTV